MDASLMMPRRSRIASSKRQVMSILQRVEALEAEIKRITGKADAVAVEAGTVDAESKITDAEIEQMLGETEGEEDAETK